jgi:hypothetical protein
LSLERGRLGLWLLSWRSLSSHAVEMTVTDFAPPNPLSSFRADRGRAWNAFASVRFSFQGPREPCDSVLRGRYLSFGRLPRQALRCDFFLLRSESRAALFRCFRTVVNASGAIIYFAEGKPDKTEPLARRRTRSRELSSSALGAPSASAGSDGARYRNARYHSGSTPPVGLLRNPASTVRAAESTQEPFPVKPVV